MSLKLTTKPSRVIIEEVTPSCEGNEFYVKRAVGEPLVVSAAIFADGHQEISADLLFKSANSKEWERIPMSHRGNDIWTAECTPSDMGFYSFTVEAWINEFKTWEHDLIKRKEAGQNLTIEYKIGLNLLKEGEKRDGAILKTYIAELEKSKKPETLFLDPKLATLMRNYPDPSNITRYEQTISVRCERKKALYSTWYELFPRSYGGFKGVIGELKKISEMGFDVLYLPPIHPIGTTNRKGKNNSPKSAPGEPGSPWAIGSKEGGHDAIHPELGTFKDFKLLVDSASKEGIEIALDLAFQCSPDHPYVNEHPEWFTWRPDGTAQYAENPPKKYEDIIPLNFDSENWKELWDELLRIITFWIEKGIRIFRVDNPHTKPFSFWHWMIQTVHKEYPEVIFLAEAFTRPHLMQRLAKVGFEQSYTYFTWRNTKWELMQYINELTQTASRDHFRPNFWPNTPDILPEQIQQGGSPAFISRLVLAATLSSNYGIYGSPYEVALCEALPGKEEYSDSEKYEIRKWNREQQGNICELITLINKIRRENLSFQTTWNSKFCKINNDMMLAYTKSKEFLIIVNLDPYKTQSGMLELPLEEFGLCENEPFLAQDLLTEKKFMWEGRKQYIELNPYEIPAHIFRLHTSVRREQDFDYFM